MTDQLIVIVGDAVAGTLTRLRGGKLQFGYEQSYIAQRTATPLSVSMPLSVRSHPDHAISPWLQGLLPDDTAVTTRWAAHPRSAGSDGPPGPTTARTAAPPPDAWPASRW
jgi:serine/threonine-protein kinase HipA